MLRQRPILTSSRRRIFGASLLEAIAFLGIAALVIVGAVALMGKAFTSSKVSDAQTEYEAIRIAAKKLYSGQGNYAGLNNANLIAAQVVPATLTVAGPARITNQWGGPVLITATVGGAALNISYAGVPNAACVELLTSFKQDNWPTVTHNVAGALVPPIPVATANGACRGTDNTIVATSAN